MVFFLESPYSASSTDKVDQEEFNNYLTPQLEKLISGIKSGNISFTKRIHLLEAEYASANNSLLEDSNKTSFEPNYTEIYEY